MPTVYVLQEAPGRNITPAIKFGKLKIILPPGDISQISEITYLYLYKALREFTREDFVILMGAPRAIAAVGEVLADITGGDYGVLNWDRQCGEYFPSRMTNPNKKAHKGESDDNRTDRHVPRPAEELERGQAG